MLGVSLFALAAAGAVSVTPGFPGCISIVVNNAAVPNGVVTQLSKINSATLPDYTNGVPAYRYNNLGVMVYCRDTSSWVLATGTTVPPAACKVSAFISTIARTYGTPAPDRPFVVKGDAGVTLGSCQPSGSGTPVGSNTKAVVTGVGAIDILGLQCDSDGLYKYDTKTGLLDNHPALGCHLRYCSEMRRYILTSALGVEQINAKTRRCYEVALAWTTGFGNNAENLFGTLVPNENIGGKIGRVQKAPGVPLVVFTNAGLVDYSNITDDTADFGGNDVDLCKLSKQTQSLVDTQLYLVNGEARIPANTHLTFVCDAPQCEAQVFVYRHSPETDGHVGGLPLLLTDLGFETSSCAPSFTIEGRECDSCRTGLIAFRKVITAQDVPHEVTLATDAAYVAIVGANGVQCDGLPQETCSASGSNTLNYCQFVGDSCVSNYCVLPSVTPSLRGPIDCPLPPILA